MKEHDPDERLDAAIDDVARQMTAGAPRAGFSGRVQARLDDRAGGGWLAGFAWAAGALVVLVLALLVPWQARDTADRQRAPQVAQQQRIPPTGDAAPRASATPGLGEAAPRTAARDIRKTDLPRPRRLPSVPLVEDAPQIPALAEITPLSVDVNAPASLTLDDIDLPDLAVAPLDPDRVDKEPR